MIKMQQEIKVSQKKTFLQRLYLLKSVVKYPNHLVRLL